MAVNTSALGPLPLNEDVGSELQLLPQLRSATSTATTAAACTSARSPFPLGEDVESEQRQLLQLWLTATETTTAAACTSARSPPLREEVESEL